MNIISAEQPRLSAQGWGQCAHYRILVVNPGSTSTKLIYQAMAYQIAKEIGGLAHSKMLVVWISD